jgi:predicted dehydrogenase
VPDRPVGFGIVGAGRVAGSFAADLQEVAGARLSAVTSRTAASAQRLAAVTTGSRVHASLDALLADPDVDVVYVATPHHLHAAQSIAALAAGKAVLCEKPFALDARQTTAVVDVARRTERFCMEAMWMRFVPAVRRAVELVHAGAIGEPAMIHADFGVPTHPTGGSRFFDPEQGGGALLDRGVYAVSLATMLFGQPVDVAASAVTTDHRVDAHLGAVLRFDADRLAVMSCSLGALTSNTATISGSEGMITLHAPFFCAERLSLRHFRAVPGGGDAVRSRRDALLAAARSSRPGQVARRLAAPVVRRLRRRDERFPLVGHGYGYQAIEVVECLRAGRVESPRMPLADTVLVMDVLDRIRTEAADPP